MRSFVIASTASSHHEGKYLFNLELICFNGLLLLYFLSTDNFKKYKNKYYMKDRTFDNKKQIFSLSFDFIHVYK